MVIDIIDYQLKNKSRPYLKDIINDLNKSDTWKIQLKIAINFLSHRETDEVRVMHAKSDNMETINQFLNILRLFDVLPNFPLTTSETMCDFTYKHGIYELPHELPNDLRLRILGN